MRHAFLVPLVLAVAFPAGAAVQDRDECIRVLALENGARMRIGFNVPLPEDPSARMWERNFSAWADGASLPAAPSDRSPYVAIDVDYPWMRETRSAMLDSAALLDTLRGDPVFEIGSDPVVLLPIRDGARIADEMERCLTAAPSAVHSNNIRCRHSVPLADGGVVRFEFVRPNQRPARVGAPAAPPRWIAVAVDGWPIPSPGSRAATIVLARPSFVRSSRLSVPLDRFAAALRSGAAIELRGRRDEVLHSVAFPDRAQAVRQAEQCIAAPREAGRR